MLSSNGDARGSSAHKPGSCGDYAPTAAAAPPWSAGTTYNRGVLIRNPAATLPPVLSGSDPATVYASWGPGTVKMANITDGTSNTVFMGEKHVVQTGFGTTGAQDNSIYHDDSGYPSWRVAGTGYPLVSNIADASASAAQRFGSYHPGVVQFGLCDGSVRSISNSVPDTTLNLLVLRDDGSVIPEY
jgi:hypothetical protein